MDYVLAEKIIVATDSKNTASSEWKGYIRNPSRLVEVNFFAPMRNRNYVEVIKGEHTSEDTVELLVRFLHDVGSTPIREDKEVEGFAVGCIMKAIKQSMEKEVCNLVEAGVISQRDLDTRVKFGLDHLLRTLETESDEKVDFDSLCPKSFRQNNR